MPAFIVTDLVGVVCIVLGISNRKAIYKNLFPKHLHDDADRMCQNMFLGMYSVIVEYAQKPNRLKCRRRIAAATLFNNSNKILMLPVSFKNNNKQMLGELI